MSFSFFLETEKESEVLIGDGSSFHHLAASTEKNVDVHLPSIPE